MADAFTHPEHRSVGKTYTLGGCFQLHEFENLSESDIVWDVSYSFVKVLTISLFPPPLDNGRLDCPAHEYNPIQVVLAATE
jgi:hypothetical protein